ncbi:MAG: hypothetical protein ACFFED_03195 [Candidatus Thorarchaeota archaeon]
MPHALTTMSNIICPHGGKAILVTRQTKAHDDSAYYLLETDVHAVVGCPFMLPFFYEPCVRIEWSNGSTKTKIEDTPILTRISQGSCYNSSDGFQGYAIVVYTQWRFDVY